MHYFIREFYNLFDIVQVIDITDKAIILSGSKPNLTRIQLVECKISQESFKIFKVEKNNSLKIGLAVLS